jgi:hypothetical protein
MPAARTGDAADEHPSRLSGARFFGCAIGSGYIWAWVFID